jgi:hypothetical protein
MKSKLKELTTEEGICVYIECENEFNRVMSIFEKNDIIWFSGEIATKKPIKLEFPFYIFFNGSNLSYSVDKTENYSYVKYDYNVFMNTFNETSILTTEQKKLCWKILEDSNFLKIFSSILQGDVAIEIKEQCRPLFFTSLDNEPIWEGDIVYYIKNGNIEQINNLEEIILSFWQKGDVISSSSLEVIEKYQQDNKKISIKDTKQIIIDLVMEFLPFIISDDTKDILSKRVEEEINKLNKK